ncbi:hypothetical protein E2C01_054222 [Portunus trituberculatus]|uniref:Uncharacterized protein n=1 Tax=Portunus trituberculatus TaxID=210409 RepID=A0A5B7GUF3_PORTR|nr:hypothetical protein [Portunus trituberculatus]
MNEDEKKKKEEEKGRKSKDEEKKKSQERSSFANSRNGRNHKKRKECSSASSRLGGSRPAVVYRHPCVFIYIGPSRVSVMPPYMAVMPPRCQQHDTTTATTAAVTLTYSILCPFISSSKCDTNLLGKFHFVATD